MRKLNIDYFCMKYCRFFTGERFLLVILQPMHFQGTIDVCNESEFCMSGTFRFIIGLILEECMNGPTSFTCTLE